MAGGVKERVLAYKLGIGFVDHNHDRKECLAGFDGARHLRPRGVHHHLLPGLETPETDPGRRVHEHGRLQTHDTGTSGR